MMIANIQYSDPKRKNISVLMNVSFDDFPYAVPHKNKFLFNLTHQVPTGLLRPRIIGNFQRFFKYSKYGPISKIFFLKVPKSTKFSPSAKKAGRMHRQGASADRKRHSGWEKQTQDVEGELLR